MPVVMGDMGIKTWSYEMLVVDAGYLCEDCVKKSGDDPASDTYTPVFADTEMDYFPSCDNCGYLTTVCSLTSDGIDEILGDQVWSYIVDKRGDTEYLDKCVEALSWYSVGEWVNVIPLYKAIRDKELREDAQRLS